jgi:hypothetical protein
MKKLIPVLILSCAVSLSQAQLVLGDSIPVRISYINGERSGSSNHLNWAVTCFLQYANFEIQRSDNGTTYYTIHNFQADAVPPAIHLYRFATW